MEKYLLTEQQVKDALGVYDFQNLSQDQIEKIVSIIPAMDKEVAIAIMNQFPKYSESANAILAQLNVFYDRAMKSNDASQRDAVSTYRKILDDLSERIKKEDLTFKEKKEITNCMIDIADRIAEKDSENKKFLEKILKGVGVTLGTVALAVFFLLIAGGSKGSGRSGGYMDKDSDNDLYIDI